MDPTDRDRTDIGRVLEFPTIRYRPIGTGNRTDSAVYWNSLPYRGPIANRYRFSQSSVTIPVKGARAAAGLLRAALGDSREQNSMIPQ